MGNTHLLLMRITQSRPSSQVELTMGQKHINEGMQIPSKIKVVKIRQYAEFQRGVMSFFTYQRRWQ